MRSIRCGPSTRPTSGRPRKIESAVLLPASEFLLPTAGVAAIRERLGRDAARLGERLDGDLARFAGIEEDPLRPASGAAAGASRAVAVGDAAEVWAAHLAPATGLDHIEPGTLLLLDEPGDIAEAAAFLWRQADERRAELVEVGELPKSWPMTYLPPRDWKSRLVASRTLELTWESEPPADVAMASGARSSGDLFGWREPVLPLGRAGRLADAVSAWQEDRARIVLASDQAPRLAEILAEADHPAAVSDALVEAPPPGAIALIAPQPQRRVRGRSGRAGLRHRPRALRNRPGPPSQGASAGRAARHPGAAVAGRPRRPHRSRRRALRADAPARRGRGRARLPRALVRRRRSDLRARWSRSPA